MVQNVKLLLDLTREIINPVLLTFSRKALYMRAIHALGVSESQLYAPGFIIFSPQNLGCQFQTHQAHPTLSLLLCLTICNPMDHSRPGSSVRGILQARILEWVAISSCRASSPPRDRTFVSCVSCTGRQVLHH